MEFEEFTALWQQRFSLYQQRAVLAMQDLRQKHAVQLEQLRKYLEETLPRKHKPSADVLNLSKVRDNLIKQKK